MTWKGRLHNTCNAIAAALEVGESAAMEAMDATMRVIAMSSWRLVGPSFGIKGPITHPWSVSDIKSPPINTHTTYTDEDGDSGGESQHSHL
jgi:hypothetical protein